MYLHVLIDNHNRKVMAIELTPDKEKQTIKSFFLEKSWKVRPKVNDNLTQKLAIMN